jgi:hypothetical protein
MDTCQTDPLAVERQPAHRHVAAVAQLPMTNSPESANGPRKTTVVPL